MKAKGWQRRDLRRSHTRSNSLSSKTRGKRGFSPGKGEKNSKTRRKKQVVSYIGREAWIQYVQKL